jgi:hypothetical protein
MQGTNIDTLDRLHKIMPNRGDNFMQHLDLSNMNEMYFESNLAQILRTSSDAQVDPSKMPIINFTAEGTNNGIIVGNSRDVIGTDFVIYRPRFIKFMTQNSNKKV